MDENSLYSILSHPNSSGYVTFILSMFFILFIYNLFLYLQNKQKVYLYYCIYTFLIFISQISNDKTIIVNYFFKSINPNLDCIYIYLIWAYNSVYLLFVFEFVNIKTNSKKWYRLIKTVSFIIISFSVFEIIYYIFTSERYFFWFIEKYIIRFLFIFSLICYYPLLKYKAPLKKYIIAGSLVLFIASFLAVYRRNLYPDYADIGQFIFLTGLIIENLIFALALSKNQKLILIERNEAQQKLIQQLKENEKLKTEAHKIMEENIASMNEKAEYEKLKKAQTEYDKEILNLKMSSLRSQMNPHFIFNSLNSIKLYIIENEKNNAIYYLNKFSKLIRKILAATREETIVLNEEIETLELYMDIENIRFSNEINTKIKIDKNLNTHTIKVPSLILQPFIENAIWHGLSSKEGFKNLSISFKKENDFYLKICIEDNGVGRKKSESINKNKIHKKESIGINLTEERLKSFSKQFKGNASINIIDLYSETQKAIGTKVELLIPLI